jgi:hypothetical protein
MSSLWKSESADQLDTPNLPPDNASVHDSRDS